MTEPKRKDGHVMGFFDIFKKNSKKVSFDANASISPEGVGVNEPDHSELSSPTAFFAKCTMAFHEYAQAHGYAHRGVVFIPELIALGQKAVLAYLQDPFLTFEYSSDHDTYYYIINSFAFQTGIAYGAAWHQSYTDLENGLADQMIQDGPWEYVEPLFRDDLAMTKEQFEQFGRGLYEVWKTQHEPYWVLNDPRQYTLNATLASFQLGVSMILEKFGY